MPHLKSCATGLSGTGCKQSLAFRLRKKSLRRQVPARRHGIVRVEAESPQDRKQEPKGSLIHFALRQKTLGSFGDILCRQLHSIIALHGKERFQKLGRIDAQQVAIFALEKPEADVSERLQHPPVAALGTLRAGGRRPESSELSRKKRDNLIGFPQAIRPEDDSFSFTQGHESLWQSASARRPSHKLNKLSIAPAARKVKTRPLLALKSPLSVGPPQQGKSFMLTLRPAAAPHPVENYLSRPHSLSAQHHPFHD